MTGAVLGIDLGTTNSVVASLDDRGEVVVLRNAVGEETTPSAVYFESKGAVVVGDEARHLTAMDPDNGVTLIKRHMGTEFPLLVRGQAHTPESISALILRQLVTAAQTPARPRVVITVPAYFGMAEREATAQAGRIAGLDVLELVDEPVAAAIHYGLTAPGTRTVLVYDLGGGTFDTTVLSVADGEVTVVATDGHNKLGGADVDERLLDLVLERLLGLLPSADYDDLVGDEAKLGNLTVDVESAKRDLSTRTSCGVVVRTSTDRVTVPLGRDELESACADLFDATTDIIRRAVDTARAKGVSRIDEVIMVGGSSRIPMLATRLGQLLGVTPKLLDPDLAVAKGAALRAHQIVGSSQLRALAQTRGLSAQAQAGRVTPVVPRAVGILIEDSHDEGGERRFIAHLVHANTPLPVEQRTTDFGTILPDQDTVRIQVYEQAGSAISDEVGHNRCVLDGELAGLGRLAAGAVIELTVSIALDGRLSVVAREPISGRALALEAFVTGVVDTAEARTLAQAVGLMAVRG